MGAQSPIAMVKERQRVAEAVIQALRGEMPQHVANPAVKKNARILAKA
jgi:hypothetical protein